MRQEDETAGKSFAKDNLVERIKNDPCDAEGDEDVAYGKREDARKGREYSPDGAVYI